MKKEPIIIPKIEHSKSRLEGFSDSVFAFAATLLVVSLEKYPKVLPNYKIYNQVLSALGLAFLH